ncbi:MAG: ABA4-like family protein [Pseudomonadota bacterium]
MHFETVFSLAGMLAMVGWATLLVSPFIPIWSERLAGLIIPAILAAGYVVLVLVFPAEQGGFGSFAAIVELFSQPQALMAGWVHFLAFDLVVGAWICRKAREDGLRFWMVVPCLPVTFLFGPAGFLMFQGVRALRTSGRWAMMRWSA